MNPRLLLFFLIVPTIVGLAHYYVYRRLVRSGPHRWVRRGAAAALATMAVVLFAGPVLHRVQPSDATLALVKASYIWMAVAFYLFVCAAALHLVEAVGRHGFRIARRTRTPEIQAASAGLQAEGAPAPLVASSPAEAPDSESAPENPSRRQFLVQSASWGAVAIAVPTSGYGLWRAYSPPEITETVVRIPNLPRALSGLTIVQLTDVHVGAWVERRFIEELVSRTNALKPDLVAITGDLVDGSVSRLGHATAPLANLRSRFGTFFCNGNHEYYSGVDPWAAELRRLGITVLRNQRAVIGDREASIDLAGVEDWSADYDLEAALAGRDPSRPAVLLSHQPRGFEEAAAAGVALQLSGHTHGGQIWPWTLAVRAVYPYMAGLYRVGESSIYVSRGCGFWGPPMRVGAAPELARIVLT